MHNNVISCFATALLVSFNLISCRAPHVIDTDVVIVGGGASGVSAAIQAARMGCNVIVAEESPWLGGMLTGAGVSAIDGNRRLPAGIFGEFIDSLAVYYGGKDSLKTGWVSSVLFEPSVGNMILKKMVSHYPSISVEYDTRADGFVFENGYWTLNLIGPDNVITTVRAKVLIDGTELGDVAKAVGVGYDIGMESRDITGEDIAPESSNGIIQDLTMVATLKDYGHDVTIDEPDDYDPDEFACTANNALCKSPKEPNRMWDPGYMMLYGKLPNNKYMINWPIEGNDYYINIIEMSREQRAEAIAEAKAHTMRYIYFLQHELGFNTLGIADDEYPTADKLPFIPYHRESRRIHGKVRFNVNNIMIPYHCPTPLYRTGIAVGDYPVDHHHKAYGGAEELPDLHFHPVPSYCLPLGVIMPDSIENILVTEKSISVSNIANGTTRLQPVVMQVGQAAGAVAALSVKHGVPTGDIDVREVQHAILEAGGYLMPFLDRPVDDPYFKVYQRIGASGILEGEGRSVAWNNETWLRIDDAMMEDDLLPLERFYNSDFKVVNGRQLTVDRLIDILDTLGIDSQKASETVRNISSEESDVLTRGQYAIVVDCLLNPFSRKVNIQGDYIDD